MSLFSFKEGISVVKREQYGLSFYKAKSALDGAVRNICKREGNINEFNTLQFLGRLTPFETKGFISELQKALNSQYYEQFFVTDSTDADSIELVYPNVIFGENDLVISMQDLLDLLQEWLEFIS